MRLLLTLIGISFTLLANAQVNKYNYHLKLDDETQQIEGSLLIEVNSEYYRNTDSLVLHLPPRSLEWGKSFLNKQFIDFQRVDLYYAERNKKGYIEIEESQLDGSNFTSCKDCEFVVIPWENKEQPRLEIKFKIKVPEAKFTGIGYDGLVYRIIEWLPRLAAYDQQGWHKNPVTYQSDYYQIKDEFLVHWKTKASDSIVIASNVPEIQQTEPDANGQLERVFHIKSSSNLQFYLSKNFKEHLINEDVRLYTVFNDPYLPSILPSLDEKVNSFLTKQIGADFKKSYSLVVLNDKIGEFQSDNLLSIEYPKSTFQFASELTHARAEQLFRYEIAPNGFQDVWLARGIPYFYKYSFIANEYPDKKWLPYSNSIAGRFFELDQFDYDYQNQFLMLYINRQGLDQAMNTRADSLSRFNYDAIVEGKTYLSLSHLKEYMGQTSFKRSMSKFYLDSRDKGNTSPESLKKSFQFFFFRDLDWFFEDLVKTDLEHDYQILKTDYCSTISTATIRNKQKLAIPYSLTGIKEGKEVITEWFPGHIEKKSVQMYHEEYDEVIINQHLSVPEFSQKNNRIRTKGLFKRAEPLRLQFFNSFENPERTQIYWMPSGNYNAYDKLLMGFTIHNRSVAFVRKPFEYRISPEYSTGTGSLTGYVSGLFNFAPSGGPFHRIAAGAFARYNHYDRDLAFLRISPSATFFFRRNYAAGNAIQKLRFRGVSLDRELPSNDDDVAVNELNNASYSVFTATYSLEKINILKPFTLISDFQLGEEFSVLSTSADFRWMLPNRKWMIWRSFGGVFLKNQYFNEGNSNNYYSMGLSGTRDYLFDYELIGRSDENGIWSQQFFITDGGFKSQTNVYSDEYMLTSGLSVPVWNLFTYKGLSPNLGVFGDVGFVDEFETVYWDYGLRFSLFTDFMEVYLPIQNQTTNFLQEGTYFNHTRFVLNLDISEIIERVRRGYY